ncbi:hypothetical protein CDD82_5139 [Ophiocordyceps australis]|uniref:DNA/RNA-binding domain-containing protein n=1 Tax=Ophiocordyceps australis TaxID=1399860 RepID=A0A2C5Y489_9HYPO|nr:hypothetical protein CDD82_5139 [Ophiocordyceps australis]
MASLASSETEAAHMWRDALKSRSQLHRHIDKIKTMDPASLDLDLLDTLVVHMSYFRLACVKTIFLDIEFAEHEKAGHTLWNLHGSIRTAFRRLIRKTERLSQQNRSRVSQQYLAFLSTSRKFYKTFIQRLAARFDVSELRLAVRGIKMAHANSDGSDCISPVDPSIAPKAITMCWAALLILGDLTRYIADETSAELLDKARSYYDLAHQIKPDHGHSFHQTALIRSSRHDRVEILYNFYRCMATTFTHPAAKGNLKEFFETLHTETFRDSNTDALGMWFCKLHAFFYKGQPFKQQQELETEVIHKLTVACGDGSAGSKLIKLSLINISAEYIAATALASNAESDTQQLSRSFCLQFNGLWINTICQLLVSGLEEAMMDNGSEAKTQRAIIPFTNTVQNLLAIFRTVALEMVHSMSKVFTLVCRAFDSQAYAACPYLLPEDNMARGMLPMEGPHVPSDCRLFNDENGIAKARLNRRDSGVGSTRENQERIFGIITCAYVLHKSSALVNFKFVQGVPVFEPAADVAVHAHKPQGLKQDSAFMTNNGAVADHDLSLPLESVSITNTTQDLRHASIHQGSHGNDDHDKDDRRVSLDGCNDYMTAATSATPVSATMTSPPFPQRQSNPVFQDGQDMSIGSYKSPEVPITQGLPSQCALDFLWDSLPFPSYADEKAKAIRSAFVKDDDTYFSDEDDNVFLFGHSASITKARTATDARAPDVASQQGAFFPNIARLSGAFTHVSPPLGPSSCLVSPRAASMVNESILYHNLDNGDNNNRPSPNGMVRSFLKFDTDTHATESKM